MSDADDDAETSSSKLQVLRARLYAPDSTSADRAAYEVALAKASLRRPGEPDGPSAEPVAAEASPNPAPHPRRIRARTAAVLAVAFLVSGAAIGAGLNSIAGGPVPQATRSATVRPSLVTGSPLLPTPVAARTLPLSATARRAVTAALTKAFASDTDDTAVDRAVQAIGPQIAGGGADSSWMERHACTTSTGVVRASTRGRPLALTPADSALALPAHAHFRITIFLTRPAGWSWILSAARGTTATSPIAVGAGSPEAGAAQYAEFDATGTGDLTRVEVASTGGTPFLWQLDSCITGT